MKYILVKEKTVAIGKTLEESGWGPFQFPVLYKGIDGRIYIYFHCDLDNWQSFGKGNERWMVTNDLGDSWEDVEKDIVYQNIGLKLSNGDYLLSTLRSNPPVDLDKIKLPIKISIDTVPGENIHYKSTNINEYPLPRGTYTDIFGHRVSSFATKELPDGLYEHLDDLPMLRRTKDGKVNFEWQPTNYENNGIPVEIHPEDKKGYLLFLANYTFELKIGPDGKIWMPMTNYSCMNPKNGAFTPFMGVNVFTSIDNAKTWNLESYINYIPDNEENEFAFMCGGYCEPTIEFCPNGDVVMIIRTADVCKGDKEWSPTYITRSHDNGKTWDKPVRFMDYGVLPKSCICKDKMVVITGRPGIAIKVAEDKDWTKWSEEIEVITKEDRGYLNNEHPAKSNFYQWVGSCCNCSIINIDDETCMIAYSDFYHQCEDGISRKSINTRIFTIKD